MIAMTTTPVTLLEQPMATNNFLPSVISESYSQVKMHVQDGLHAIQDGITVIKDEFIGIYDKAASAVSRMASPVNNFIKDLTQIETELQAELSKVADPCMPNHFIPVEQALSGYMEENY
jgi:hypothetical protein